MNIRRRRMWSAFGLVAPAYVWLAITVFLPLSAMLYFSFLAKTPLLHVPAVLTLKQYHQFFARGFYSYLLGRSLMLGFYVTLFCLLFGYPAALLLSRYVKARSREAILLLIVLPFWSNALIRVFSWTIVFREGGLLDQFMQ